MPSPLILPSFFPRLGRRGGAALVIVLAFVVLVTGLIVAFFSRAIAERQISNSSANETKVDLAAQGAVDAIIGDLKQEIAAGSTSYTGTDGVTIYVPTTPVTAVPALALAGNSGVANTSFAPNLLKRSAYGQLLYTGASNYNLPSNTVPAAGTSAATTIVYTAPNRAAKAPTTNISQNGRFISLARWNKALLLPKATTTSSSDFTPVTAAPNAFVAPDWILVARDGSNPAISDFSGANGQYLTTGTNPVTSRYAYTIYDEGGLLDMNVAGYPGVMGTGASAGTQVQGKGSLALADLTALTDSSGNSLLKQAQIDALVGWRNVASTQAPGAFPNPAFTTTSGTNYYKSVSTNTKGFLGANAFLPSTNQSDRMFTSRQQLIKLLSAVGALGSNTLAVTQNALQYLGTFSRDLEQPSFVPDPNRPKNTGHEQATSGSESTTVAGGNSTYDSSGKIQDQVNPSLLTVRDATGQPVMKRRFPLSRIAWLTYKGPIADASGSLNPTGDAGITTIINTLENTYGFSAAYLQQGTPANVRKWFGLYWDTTNSRWLYTCPDSTSTTTPASTIKTLAAVAAVTPAREPDFFETLYAVIQCDSLGKQHGTIDATNGTSLAQYSPHVFFSGGAAIDGSVEFQIIQIGANLIDQYDLDSYSTCIGYTDSSVTTPTIREFYGVENLPYLAGWMQPWYRMKKLVYGADYSTTVGVPPKATDGTAYETWTMIQPIIWNPHAPNPNLDTSLVPTSFRVLATSVYTAPGPPGSLAIAIRPQVRPAWWAAGWLSTYPLSNGAYTGTTFSDAAIDGVNSFITFNATPNTSTSGVPASFLEPYRLLYNFPQGSNAGNTTAGMAAAYVNSSTPAEKISLDAFGAVVDPTLAISDAPSPGDGKTILGFFAGKCWTGPYNYSVPTADRNVTAGETANCLINGRESDNLQFRLQYQTTTGGPWLTYDVINQVECYNAGACVDDADVAPTVRGFRTDFRADPRTDRWGLGSMFTFPLAVNPSGEGNPSADVGGRLVYNLPQGTTLHPNAGLTSNPGVVYTPGGENVQTKVSGWTSFTDFSDVMVNLNVGTTTSAIPGNKTYYVDPDGVLRRASGAWFNSPTPTQNSDGLPLATGNYNSRPVVLNHPFRSVAEMGYTFRGTAWKELDFFTQESGDTALLDAFCINEVQNAPTDVTVAGKVDLNTRQPQVLQAILSGVSKAEGGILSGTGATSEAAKIAQALVNWTTNTTITTNATYPSPGVILQGPLRNRCELVGKFIKTISNTSTTKLEAYAPVVNWDGSLSYSGFSSLLTGVGTGAVFANASDGAIERRRECVMRALADSGDTRTWNLMVDLVAQVGRYPTNASGLDKFAVEGETRYWVHLSIDRYTGTVVAKLVEPVSE